MPRIMLRRLLALTVFVAPMPIVYASPPEGTSDVPLMIEEASSIESDIDDVYLVTTSIADPQPSPGKETLAPDAAKKAAAAKKKKEALQKKVGGAYKDLFYQNDFSYLKDPDYQGHHLGESLKQIPIGEHGKLDFGGQYRLRYHHEQDMRGAGLTGRDDDFLLDRTRFYFNYRLHPRARVFAEFMDAGSSFEHYAPRQIEVQHLDAQNLFGDLVLFDDAPGKLTGRVGRQELSFGAQRLISPLDWANTRRRFDGGRVTWENDVRTTDFLAVRPLRIDPDRFDAPNQDQALYGIYNSNKTFQHGPIDTYWLGFEDRTLGQNVQTLGTLIKGEADGLLWDNEFGYQFGRNPNGSDISAYSLTFGLGRKLKGDGNPTVWMYYDWASGGSAVNTGWNHLFPLSHRYNGFMDLFGRRNLHDINVLTTWSPTQKWTLLAWYHYLALANANQGPYSVTLAPFNPGGTVGSRDLGHEIDLLGTYKVSARSDLVLGYSHFFAGDYYRTSTNALGASLFHGDADFFYTQWHYNF